MKYIYAIILGCLASSLVFAQGDPRDSTEILDVDNETQIMIENLVDDADATEFSFDTEFERLETYRKNPLDINSADRDELSALGLLSDIQVQGLINYRNRFGQIFSLYELMGVPTFDESTIFKIVPYISLEETKAMEAFSFKRAFKYSRNQIFVRYQRTLEVSDGYLPDDSLSSPEYMGSADKLYFRYRMSYKDRLSFGLTMEKDAGEQYLTPFSQNSNVKLPDYFSAHFYLKDVNKYIKAVALGDYQVYMGQGLTMWAGFGMRKGANTLNVKRLARTLRPYTSVNEAAFLRGGAVNLAFGKLETTVFASHRFRDANISLADTTDDASLEVLQVSSLQETGLHRTTGELLDKNSLQQITTGGNVRYKGKSWQIGGNFVYNRFSDSIIRSTTLYQQYAFNGQSLMNASLDYSLWYRNLQFFGETALSSNGGLATINGFTAALDPRVGLSLVHRYYARNYQTLWGNSFGEGSNTNNESGIYMGLNADIGKGMTMSGYIDMFKFPWLRSSVDAPSRGYEYFFRLDYTPSYRWGAYFQYRFEEKESNRSENTTAIDYLILKRRQNLRLHLRYRINREFEIRTRAELSFYKDHEFNRGFMMYQDLVWSPGFAPLKVNMRFAIFDAPDYDTRIYAYENDVLYAFSVPAYYGRGTRFYLNLSYKVNRNVAFWLRYAVTSFSDRNSISSGNDEVLGNKRSEIKAQVRVSF